MTTLPRCSECGAAIDPLEDTVCFCEADICTDCIWGHCTVCDAIPRDDHER